MNLELKAIYYCATANRTWGKGFTIREAKKAACLHNTKTDYYIMAALFNNPTADELENLRQCIAADQIHGSPKFYDNPTEEDSKMINERFVGWLMVEKHYKSEEKEEARRKVKE